MRVKLLSLNKHAVLMETFEKRVQAVIDESPEAVAGLHVAENLNNGDITFLIQFAGDRKLAQQFCLLGWTQVDRIEALLNSTLEGIAANRMSGRFINIVTSMKSPRVLAALIVESMKADITSEIESEGQAERPQEQDTSRDPKSKPGRQRKIVQGN